MSCGTTQFNPTRIMWFRKLTGSWLHAECVGEMTVSIEKKISLEQEHWLMRQRKGHVDKLFGGFDNFASNRTTFPLNKSLQKPN